MVVCCVIGCQSGSPAYSHENVQMFPFPDVNKAPKLRKEWLEQIGIVFHDGTLWNPKPESRPRICQKHFLDEDFLTAEENVDKQGRRRQRLTLRPRAKPTQYLRSPPPQESNIQKKKREEQQMRPGPSGEHNYVIDEGSIRIYGSPSNNSCPRQSFGKNFRVNNEDNLCVLPFLFGHSKINIKLDI